MKIKDMRTKTDKELNKRMLELQTEIVDSIQKRNMGELQNCRKTSVLKRELAQLKTIIREQELATETKEQTS